MADIKPFSPVCPEGYCPFCFWHKHIYVPLNHIVVTIPTSETEWATNNAEFRRKYAENLFAETLEKYDFANGVLEDFHIYLCKIGDNHMYHCPSCGIRNDYFLFSKEDAFVDFSYKAKNKLDDVWREQIKDVLKGLLD